MNFHNLFLCLLIVGIVSCKEIPTQYPINQPQENNVNTSAIRNKRIYTHELQLIQNRIEADATLDFKASEKGFWYAFIDHPSSETPNIESGDIINFKIKIETIDQQLIYDWDVIETITYQVNKEDILPILREGIPLMKQGKKAVFYCPSYLGFGYLGDGNKIGINQPLRITLEILNHSE